MKISTKGRYGLRILLDLAIHRQNERPRMIREIAQSEQISEKYISRLILELRNAGLIESSRGAKGGYKIAKNPAEISILELIEVMEGPIAVVDCVGPQAKPCERSPLCGPQKFWNNFNEEIRAALQRFTVQDMLDTISDSEISCITNIEKINEK